MKGRGLAQRTSLKMMTSWTNKGSFLRGASGGVQNKCMLRCLMEGS